MTMTMTITIEKVGRRHFLRNLPFAMKDVAKAAGCKWDTTERAWYSGKRETAESVLSRIVSVPAAAPQERKAPGLDATVAGRATYNGKTYYVAGRIDRGRTQWDDAVSPVTTRDGAKILLYSRDGSFEFWAASEAVKPLTTYQTPKTIAGLRAYAERAKAGGGGQLEDGYYYGQGGEVLASGCSECKRRGVMCASCQHDAE